MSLINQMLRDLQKQKKSIDSGKEGLGEKEPLRPHKAERIPFLPLPVVLGSIALATACLIWWLAGVLSDAMFGFEPTDSPVAQRQTAVVEQAPLSEAAPASDLAQAVESSSHSTSMTELSSYEDDVSEFRTVSNTVVVEPPTLRPEDEVPIAIAPLRPVPTVLVPVKKVEHLKKIKPAVKKKRAQPKTKTHTVKTVKKATVKAPERPHPDDLPGAVLSRVEVPEPPPSALSVVRATTPYGKAEEAFQDGKWALDHKRNSMALRSLQHALELYSGHLPARELLAEALGKYGKSGEAMFVLAEGLEIAPDYVGFKKAYARLLVEQGDYDAATGVLLKGGLPAVNDDPEIHVLMASLYQRLDEPFLAAQTYRNLLVAWPQTGAFWVGLGGALESQGLTEDALRCYQRALETKGLRQDLSLYAKRRLAQYKE